MMRKDHKGQAQTLSAGVIVVRRHADGYRYLLLRAYNYWDFPKGLVEAGEYPLASAVREVAEETTLTDLNFRWGEDYRETEPYARGKMARYYVAESPHGEVSLPVSPELGQPEHHEFRWLDHKAARKLLAPRVQPILDWAQALIAA
jgi:bis(5'-nucleosidyl)-tetraphosphatase